MEYIKIKSFVLQVWRANCVYVNWIHKTGSLVSKNMLYKLCNKKLKYVKFLKRYVGFHWLTNVSPVTIRLFLELWDSIYLLVTSEYVFVSAA